MTDARAEAERRKSDAWEALFTLQRSTNDEVDSYSYPELIDEAREEVEAAIRAPLKDRVNELEAALRALVEGITEFPKSGRFPTLAIADARSALTNQEAAESPQGGDDASVSS